MPSPFWALVVNRAYGFNLSKERPMTDVQLQAVVVLHTGTGVLYSGYSQGPDNCIWQNNATPATRSILQLNRTKPKPTLTFPGVDRLEFKNTQYFTVGTTEYQSVISMTSSVPVVADAAHRQLLVDRMCFMTQKAAWSDALKLVAFPT
jgi:hypothetical protein